MGMYGAMELHDLQQLWLGVSTFDALSRRDFDLHAALQEDTMLMQMMVNSLLGTFLALPGNMMEVPIFQMSNMVVCTPVIYLFSNMEWFGMCLTTYVFPLFLLLALVILNEGGFPDVEKQIGTLWHERGEDLCSDLLALSCEPDLRIRVYSACIVDGVRYHTVDREKYRRTQNSGVMAQGTHNGEDIEFYGSLREIIQ
ncbi:hypothetical protein ACJX0J_033708, partial [Zea mays]